MLIFCLYPKEGILSHLNNKRKGFPSKSFWLLLGHTISRSKTQLVQGAGWMDSGNIGRVLQAVS